MDTDKTLKWQLNATWGTAQRGAVAYRVDLRRPASGLQIVSPPLQDNDAGLLGVVFDDSPQDAREEDIDCFVRQGDLVATYPATQRRPARVQVYWRQLPDRMTGLPAADLLFAAELQVSVQTDAMDIIPLVSTSSRIVTTSPAAGAEPFRLDRPEGGCLIGCRLAAEDLHYAEMVHPADYQRTDVEIERDGRCHWQHRLMAGRLEKGVIVRARVRGLLFRGQLDSRQLADGFATFAQAAPPLTT